MTPYPEQDISALNTLAVPSVAQHFARARSLEEVQAACRWARQQGLKVQVLGGGSNVLAAAHVPGLVLKPDLKGITPVRATADYQWIDVAAGEEWHQLVCHTLDSGWYGLENLSLIPGTVGAAPVQNIGAYGVELSQVFDSLQAVHIATGKVETFDAERCAFGYRDSAFKSALRGQYVITQVRLRLALSPRVTVEYPALAEALGQTGQLPPTPELISRVVCDVRRSKLPDPAVVPNVGSFFKNPVVTEDAYRRLRDQYPRLASYDASGGKKLAAGWLIEHAGWKGKSLDGVVVHSQQALVLTNPQRLPLKQVLAVAHAIQADVERKFGVALEVEPQDLN
jgi:UDP-N-acetylmuramate dehydrogenase